MGIGQRSWVIGTRELAKIRGLCYHMTGIAAGLEKSGATPLFLLSGDKEMKSEFILAINQLCAERKLSRDVVLEAVEAALISAYKRHFGSASNIEVQVEPNTGEVRVFSIKEVVEAVQDQKAEVTLPEARQVDPHVAMGATIRVESTPRDFGRIAAQTAKQVILQRIREAERDAQYSKFADSAGEIAHGTVQSVDFHTNDVVLNLEGAEAILPAREQVPTERYRRGSRLRAYVVDVRRGNRGPQITLSRRSPALLRRLLELEVPEIHNGTVEIKAIAREAGSRSKVAVHATQEGVDPVGSCVGVRGGRIQSVVNELNGEKIDVVQWDSDIVGFIANALSPAKVMNVLLHDDPEAGRTATVIVPDRQLSLAIGKEGQNARLAAKLTGWRIDIKSATETAEETLGRLEDIVIPPEEMDLLQLAESILRRDTGQLTEAEMSLIEQEVQQGLGSDLDWPAEEPVVGEVPGAVPAEAMEGETEPGALPVEELALGEALTAEEADLAGQPMAALVPEIAPAFRVETEPTFEGEPVEDSLGWVETSPPEEYQYVWEEEEEVGAWGKDWEEEPEEEEPPKEDKKKKKRRDRRSFDYADDFPAQGLPKRGKSSPRSR
jgi:transcription termination/antitermination protein NusA